MEKCFKNSPQSPLPRLRKLKVTDKINFYITKCGRLYKWPQLFTVPPINNWSFFLHSLILGLLETCWNIMEAKFWVWSSRCHTCILPLLLLEPLMLLPCEQAQPSLLDDRTPCKTKTNHHSWNILDQLAGPQLTRLLPANAWARSVSYNKPNHHARPTQTADLWTK